MSTRIVILSYAKPFAALEGKLAKDLGPTWRRSFDRLRLPQDDRSRRLVFSVAAC